MKYIIPLTNLIVRNNSGAVARALMELGYDKKFIQNEELEKALLQLYMADPDKYFDVLISIPWNYGHTETNKDIRDSILKSMNITDTIETKGEWWKKLVEEIRSEVGSQRSKGETNTSVISRQSSASNWNYFFYGIGATLAIVLIIYLIKKIFSN